MAGGVFEITDWANRQYSTPKHSEILKLKI